MLIRLRTQTGSRTGMWTPQPDPGLNYTLPFLRSITFCCFDLASVKLHTSPDWLDSFPRYISIKHKETEANKLLQTTTTRGETGRQLLKEVGTVVSTCLQTTAMTMTITVHEFHSTGLRNGSEKAAVQCFQTCLHGKRKQFFSHCWGESLFWFFLFLCVPYVYVVFWYAAFFV